MLTTSATLLGKLRQADDPKAWERFVHLYSPILYTWVGRLGLQHADALDLVQDVFATLVKKLPDLSYNPERGFRNWLFMVTRNKFLERARRRAVRVEAGVRPEDVAGSVTQDATEKIEQADFHRHLLGEVLPTMSRSFQASTWLAFQKHVVDGQPAHQVADELGITVSAVFKAKARVLSRLHRELGDLVDD